MTNIDANFHTYLHSLLQIEIFTQLLFCTISNIAHIPPANPYWTWKEAVF